MIKSIYTGLVAESQKSKGTFNFWFTIIAAGLIPLVTFFIYFFRHEYFLPADGSNPWGSFIERNVQTVAFLLFPFYIILSVALNINIEHKEDSWKKLFVLPVKRETIYLSKLIYLFSQVFVSLLIFMSSVLLFGAVLGIAHGELKLLDYAPELLPFVKLLLRLIISVLGILAIQYCLSLFFKNIIIPISIGTFLMIVSNLIAKDWEYSVFVPYASPIRFFFDLNEMVIVDIYFGLRGAEITSLVTFIIVSIIGVIVFKTKKIN